MNADKLNAMDRKALVSITLALAAEVDVLQASERALLEAVDGLKAELAETKANLDSLERDYQWCRG